MTEITSPVTSEDDDDSLLDRELMWRFIRDTIGAAKIPPTKEDLVRGFEHLLDIVVAYGMVACWIDGDVDLVWDVDREEIAAFPKKTLPDTGNADTDQEN